MKQTYVEPDVLVLRLDLEMSILNGGSNEGLPEDPIPGQWAPMLPTLPSLPTFPF